MGSLKTPRRFLLFALLLLMSGLLSGAAGAMNGDTGAFGDQGDGAYVNPVLPGDYQNTDVVRVGPDYYYISATKALSPGMLVLHSTDLVNWTPLGHVIPDITVLSPRYNFDRMDGAERGVWAGAIAFHDKRFYVYFTTPDEGVFMSMAANPAGPWAPLTCLLKAPGWDDPCPFWDDDGQAYLVMTNFAVDPKDGKPYHIHLYKMTADGKALIATSDTLIHQSQGSEANKLFKTHGFYYHFYSQVTPEGRVPMIERARAITGPYEGRPLLHMHRATDREPNQGTLLQTRVGDWVFITHHGVSGWEGRPASLLPVTWRDDWPIAGTPGPDGIGAMVWSAPKPIKGASITGPETDDDFHSPTLGPQWEWYFQPRADKWSLTERPGALRLHAFRPLAPGDLLHTGNILTLRPLTAARNVATVCLDISRMADGQTAGLGLLGRRYASLGVAQTAGAKRFVFNEQGQITDGPPIPDTVPVVWLRANWDPVGKASFQCSTDGKTYISLGNSFQITNFGSFLGAKIGLYTVNATQDAGLVDIDSFQYAFSRSAK